MRCSLQQHSWAPLHVSFDSKVLPSFLKAHAYGDVVVAIDDLWKVRGSKKWTGLYGHCTELFYKRDFWHQSFDTTHFHLKKGRGY